MRNRNWLALIAINVVISAAVVVGIIYIWNRVQGDAPAPTPAFSETQPATLAVDVVMTPAPTLTPVPREPVRYTVQDGDTLGGIAEAYGVTVEALAAANDLANPDVLGVGQVLMIPVEPTPAPVIPTQGQEGIEPSPLPATPEPSPAPLPSVTPEPSPAGPLATPLPTLTPAGPPLVGIDSVVGAGDATREVVVVGNQGGPANLKGWTLGDAEGNVYTFPDLILFTQGVVRVHSAIGNSTPQDLYWGRANPAWESGGLISLRDGAGNVVDTAIVP